MEQDIIMRSKDILDYLATYPWLKVGTRRDLSPSEKVNDTKVRKVISAEQGHKRIQIVAVYLGGLDKTPAS